MTLKIVLSQLAMAELVRATNEPDAFMDSETWRFKHALIQDTTYASLLKHDRKTLHHAVGDALELVYAQQLDEFSALLARHYAEAEDDTKTFAYALRAGDAALRVYANAEAIMYYTQALRVMPRLAQAGSSPSGENIQHLFSQRGRALELASRYHEAIANYQEMEKVAQARGDNGMALASIAARSTLYATFTQIHDAEQARLLAEQGLSLARRQGNRATEAKLLWNLLLVYTYGLPDAERAIMYGEQGLALAQELNLREQIAFTLNDLTYSYVTLRPLDDARLLVEQAQQEWRALGNQPMLVDALSNGVYIETLRGAYTSACALAEQALALAEPNDNYWGQAYAQMQQFQATWERGQTTLALHSAEDSLRLGLRADFRAPAIIGRNNLAILHAELGALKKGVEIAEEAVALAERDMPYFHLWSATMLVRCYVRSGDLAAAEELLTTRPFEPEHLNQFVAAPVPQFISIARIELALAQNNYAAAEAELDTALETVRGRGILGFLPQILTLQAQLRLAQARVEQAQELLQQARTLAEHSESIWQLWQIDARLMQAAIQRDDLASGRAAQERARANLNKIVAQMPPEFHLSFLNTACAQFVLSVI
jgi:MalT-like TPR region